MLAKVSKAQDHLKRLFDPYSFQPGDQALVVLPIVRSPFQAKCRFRMFLEIVLTL